MRARSGGENEKGGREDVIEERNASEAGNKNFSVRRRVFDEVEGSKNFEGIVENAD